MNETNRDLGCHCFGNWKCNGTAADLRSWAENFDPGACRAAVFVPHPYLRMAGEELAGKAQVGCQDLSAHAGGPHTGEVSAVMAADCGAQLALVGHSECRQAGQSNEDVARRLARAVDADLVPVLCVGESLAEREAGQLAEVLSRQLQAAVEGLERARNPLIAYEPVWAIGTGRAASAEDARQAAVLVREILGKIDSGLKPPILYGGSVKAANAAELMAAEEVNGLLVGGASLDAAEFSAICAAAG